MNDWIKLVKESNNTKVLLMLSGGKDSIATLLCIVKAGIEVDAIHFYHKWSELIPLEEAERICGLLSVNLIKYDFSNAFSDAVTGYANGRPCLLCKKKMYACLVDYLKNHSYGWIAVGDNANDQTTIDRMVKFSNPFGEGRLECSDYFGSEMGCNLPHNTHVLRPLISMTAQEVEEYLLDNNIKVRRIQSTGDKYFDYHREGCPVQFVDIGVKINNDIMCDLQRYNATITEFARKKGIRASIHIPSTYIITIPKGYETEAAEYLHDEGLVVNSAANSNEVEHFTSIVGYVELINGDYFIDNSYKKCFERFSERMGLETDSALYSYNKGEILCNICQKSQVLTMIFSEKMKTVDIIMRSKNKYEKNKFENLIIEIFRSNKFIISEISSKEK